MAAQSVDTAQARPSVFDDSAPACHQHAAGGPVAAGVMGEAADSGEVARAIALARQQDGAAWRRAQTAVEDAIRQLLPFSMERLAGWGNPALQDNARLVEAAASLQRAQSVLGINEIIQQALDARTPHKGFLERLRGGAAPVRLDNLRVRAAGLSARLAQLALQIEALRLQAREQAERMDVLVTALASAAQVGGDRLDAAVDTALQNRRMVLLQASQQARLLLPQIDEMRRQLADHEARLTQFISVTLPAMDMAAAQAAG